MHVYSSRSRTSPARPFICFLFYDLFFARRRARAYVRGLEFKLYRFIYASSCLVVYQPISWLSVYSLIYVSVCVPVFSIFPYVCLSCYLCVCLYTRLHVYAFISYFSLCDIPWYSVCFPNSLPRATTRRRAETEPRAERRTRNEAKKSDIVCLSDNIGKHIKWLLYSQGHYLCDLVMATCRYCLEVPVIVLLRNLFFLFNICKHFVAWVSVLLRYALYTRTRDRVRGRNT